MPRIMYHASALQNKSRAGSLMVLVTFLISFLGMLLGIPQAYADDTNTLIEFPSDSDTLVTNTGAFKNFTIKKLDNLDDGRYSDVYFYENYDYYANLTYEIHDNRIYESDNWQYDEDYGFKNTKVFCYDGGDDIQNPITLNFSNIGVYRDGRKVNMTLEITSLKRSGTPNEQYKGRAAFIDISNGSTKVNNWLGFDSCSGDKTWIRYKCIFSFAETNELLPQDTNICFNYCDIDIVRSIREQIRPFNNNFYDEVFLSKNTKIKIYDSKNSYGEQISFEGGGNTVDTDPASMVIFHAMNESEFQWGGSTVEHY